MKTRIRQNSPLAKYLSTQEEIDTAIKDVLMSGNYILSDQVVEFEKEFSEYIDSKFSLGVANGTDALLIALKSLSIGLGDEVITVSHTAIATVAAITESGATPVLVDIEPDTYTIDTDMLERAITSKTKAIIPVHIYGQAANMEEILRISKLYKIDVIEDVSQAHGGIFQNQKLGSFGKISVFSCYPTKNLGAIGDAAILTTNDQTLYEKMKSIRQYGWISRNLTVEKGINSRLDELQAAILRVKLRHLDKDNRRRIEIANIYSAKLSGIEVVLPKIRKDSLHVFHQFVILTPSRDLLRSHLENDGIETSIHYEVPIHKQKGYIEFLRMPDKLSITEKLSDHAISLPMYPELSDDEVKYVVSSIEDFFRKKTPK